MELKKELLEFLEANNLFGLEDRENAEGVVDSYLKVYKKQLTLTDVVVELPSKKSKEFERWTQSKGYESAFNGLWYEKNNQTYNTNLLYRAFTNEIEFGN